MSIEPTSPGRQDRPPSTLADAYAGFVLFGGLDLVVLSVASMLGVDPTAGPTQVIAAVALLAVVGAVAAWASFVLRRPSLAAGLLGGYALMTIISGGGCTLFTSTSLESGLNVLTGALLYIVAVALFGLGLLIRWLIQSRRP